MKRFKSYEWKKELFDRRGRLAIYMSFLGKSHQYSHHTLVPPTTMLIVIYN